MVAARLSPFGGMIPAVDDTLLPDQNASFTENAWVFEGTVTGLNPLTYLRDMVNPTYGKVYRLPNGPTDAAHILDSVWMEFPSIDTDVVRSLVVGDTFERYYWTSPLGTPRYNTRARITAGLPGFILGIPSPTITSVTHTGGASSTTTSRAYIATNVSAYGEEGPPSLPILQTGKIDDTWTINLVAADPNDLGVNRNLASRNIYRTITATDGTTTYFFVKNISIATLTTTDTASDALISANEIIQSTDWSAPPSDLQGLITMSNGMVAGWRNNEIWFCEPFRMHAWPAKYVFTVEYPVIGLGASDQSLIICTSGFPHVATGINPGSMSVTKLAGLLPCTSRGSVLSTPEGVYYCSPMGLILVSPAGVVNVVNSLIMKDKWLSLVPTPTLRAARLMQSYYAFGSSRPGVFQEDAFQLNMIQRDDYSGAYKGVLIDPASNLVAFGTLASTDIIDNVQTDVWSGEIFIIKKGKVYWLDITNQAIGKSKFVWRSKVLQPPDKKNFQAMKVFFKTPPGTATQSAVRNVDPAMTMQAGMYGIVRVYANGRLVTTRELRESGEMMRIASGFKADYWQFEIESVVEILSMQAATSPTELRSV